MLDDRLGQFRADTRLAEKIQHGKMISTGNLIESNGIVGAHRTGSEIKIVDWEGDLIAILRYKEPGHRLAYHSVFPK